MSEHDQVFGEAAWRPKGSRIDTREQSTSAPIQWSAAAGGRSDVLDPSAVMDLQRLAGNSAVGAALEEQDRSPVHDVINSGGGSPLPEEVAGEMSHRLGQDFSDVRVHTGGQAHDSAVAVNAQAYTVGNNVVFQRDKYDPGSDSGKLMLAHELTHVVQQRNGPVDGSDAGGGIRVSDPSDRFEREASANAETVMSGPAPAAPGAAVQREMDSDEEELQTFVQRESDSDEEEELQTFVQRESDAYDEEELQTFVQRDESEEDQEDAVG